MTGMLIRLAIYIVIFGAIYLGIRKIVRDWRGNFKNMDAARRERDLKERERPDIIELKRDKDGVYRPDGGEKRDGKE